MHWTRSRALLGASFAVLGCFSLDDGSAPPLDTFYAPTALALGAEGERLYVANSDWNLPYNQGTLLALDAEEIRSLLPLRCREDADCDVGRCDIDGLRGQAPTYLCESGGSVCGSAPEATELERQNGTSGPCGSVALSRKGIIRAAVRIAPFAEDLAYVKFRTESGKERARLLLPVRGDATLHWADVETSPGQGPELSCGQGKDRSCDDNHRRGKTPEQGNLTETGLPGEPGALAVTSDGRAVVVTHQTGGRVSLFENTDDGPRLQFVLDGLPSAPRGVASVPVPAWVSERAEDYQPGFLLTFIQSGAPSVQLIRYMSGDAASPTGPFLQRVRGTSIRVNSSGADSRGIAIDDTERGTCEAECETDECLAQCALVPLGVYVANRSPDSLLVGETFPVLDLGYQDDLAHLSDAAPLRGAPSRVVRGQVLTDEGPETRIFVLAFETSELFIYDPARQQVETRIRTGAGPSSLVTDAQHGLLYVTHFSDSTLGVYDAHFGSPTYGRRLLTVGKRFSLETGQ